MLTIESRDILNYTIAFCILWFTVFLCYIMYYVIAMLKKANDSLTIFHAIVTTINTIINSAKEKLTKSFASIELVGVLIKKIVEQINIKKENKKTKTKSKK